MYAIHPQGTSLGKSRRVFNGDIILLRKNTWQCPEGRIRARMGWFNNGNREEIALGEITRHSRNDVMIYLCHGIAYTCGWERLGFSSSGRTVNLKVKHKAQDLGKRAELSLEVRGYLANKNTSPSDPHCRPLSSRWSISKLQGKRQAAHRGCGTDVRIPVCVCTLAEAEAALCIPLAVRRLAKVQLTLAPIFTKKHPKADRFHLHTHTLKAYNNKNRAVASSYSIWLGQENIRTPFLAS